MTNKNIPELRPGTILQGRYEIECIVGSGAMGRVYKARHKILNKFLALKQSTADDIQTQNALQQEAQLLAQSDLSHPGLPKVTDHFSEADSNFLVMDFVAGQNLAELLDQQRTPFPPDTVARWADELLDILTYLHRRQPPVIHRDIKPGNIMLTSDNQLMLVDFGLAGGTNQGGYTQHYAPPEQCGHAITEDPRSDLYALGATLYTLLTAKIPPDASERQKTVASGQSDPLKKIHELNSEVPQELSELLKRMMDLDPHQRPGSAAELQTTIQQYLSKHPSQEEKVGSVAVKTKIVPPPDTPEQPPSGETGSGDTSTPATSGPQQPLQPPIATRKVPQRLRQFGPVAVIVALMLALIFLAPNVMSQVVDWDTTRQTAVAVRNITTTAAADQTATRAAASQTAVAIQAATATHGAQQTTVAIQNTTASAVAGETVARQTAVAIQQVTTTAQAEATAIALAAQAEATATTRAIQAELAELWDRYDQAVKQQNWESAVHALDAIIETTGATPRSSDYPDPPYDSRIPNVANLRAQARLEYARQLQLAGELDAARAQYEAVATEEGVSEELKQQAGTSRGFLEQAVVLWEEVNRDWNTGDWVAVIAALETLRELEGFGPQAQDPAGNFTVEELIEMATNRPTSTPVPPSPPPTSPPPPPPTVIPPPPPTVIPPPPPNDSDIFP